MPEYEEIKLEPLGFLEKSHCVPILIALDKNGMMNRNQIYKELGETIRVVIKRIELLKRYGLIYEIEMEVKPFAKYVDLTIKGKRVAQHLTEIEMEMAEDNEYPISLFHFIRTFTPDGSELDLAFSIKDSHKSRKKTLASIQALSRCPQCSSTLHIMGTEEDPNWTCLRCGFRKKAARDEMVKLWALEHIMNIPEKKT